MNDEDVTPTADWDEADHIAPGTVRVRFPAAKAQCSPGPPIPRPRRKVFLRQPPNQRRLPQV
jgi:hypothetical protein